MQIELNSDIIHREKFIIVTSFNSQYVFMVPKDKSKTMNLTYYGISRRSTRMRIVPSIHRSSYKQIIEAHTKVDFVEIADTTHNRVEVKKLPKSVKIKWS